MGMFSRKNTNDSQTNPEIVERGRNYAIAKRHGDHRTANKILQQMGSEGLSETDRKSFHAGAESYDSIPPVPGNSRRRNR